MLSEFRLRPRNLSGESPLNATESAQNESFDLLKARIDSTIIRGEQFITDAFKAPFAIFEFRKKGWRVVRAILRSAARPHQTTLVNNRSSYPEMGSTRAPIGPIHGRLLET